MMLATERATLTTVPVNVGVEVQRCCCCCFTAPLLATTASSGGNNSNNRALSGDTTATFNKRDFVVKPPVEVAKKEFTLFRNTGRALDFLGGC